MQGVLGPMTPAGLSAFRMLASSFARLFSAKPSPGTPAVFTVAGGRIFLDVTDILDTELGHAVVQGTTLDAATGRAVQDLHSRPPGRQPASARKLPLKAIKKITLIRVALRVLTAVVSPEGPNHATGNPGPGGPRSGNGALGEVGIGSGHARPGLEVRPA